MNYKIFHYYPADIDNSYTGAKVKGFKFPADGKEYKEAIPVLFCFVFVFFLSGGKLPFQIKDEI